MEDRGRICPRSAVDCAEKARACDLTARGAPSELFIYLLCQSVANWAYLRIEDRSGRGMFARILCESDDRTLFFPLARPPSMQRARFYSRHPRTCDYKGYNIRLWRGFADRRKNSRITFGDRGRPAIRLWQLSRHRASRCVLAIVPYSFSSLFARDSQAGPERLLFRR